jgi:hypothetical protein
MNRDILNFMFATSSPRKSLEKVLCRQAGRMAEATLARHRAIGGHARCPCIRLRHRQLLGHVGASSEEHLVRRLPAKCRVWGIFVLCSVT